MGGHDVREYKLDSLMKNISMVFQSVYLFNDTVENNIKFWPPRTPPTEQVVAAAKAACCHDFIMALPDGYDTVLERAAALFPVERSSGSPSPGPCSKTRPS